ncbi:MAG: hypothetical protein U5L45_23410 [Saprospiraceae bacterium]|nr:hypothetical protein [Saprospiraceae bacterium]
MRKHLIWITALLALAFAGDRLIGYFLSKITQNSQFRYSRLYNSNQDADILFVGNSRGLTFFQPEVERLTQQKTMNLSYNGMPADLAKVLVMDYLDHHKPPKVMVVDVTLCDRENDILKSGFNMYTPKSKRLDTLLRGMHTGDDKFAGTKVVVGGNISHLYRHNSEVFQRVLFHRNKTDEDWLIDRVIGEQATKDTSFRSYKVRMFPNMAEHFKEMVEYARAKGVDVKLVINPYYPAFAETIRDSFLTPLKSHIETITGLPVNDFSTSLTNVDEIGDYQHANKKGSMQYMKLLLEKGILAGNEDLNGAMGNSSMPTNMENVKPVTTFLSENASPLAHRKPENLPELIPVTPEKVEEPKVVTKAPPSVAMPVSVSSTSFVAKKRRKKGGHDSDYGFAVDTLFLN